MLAPYPLELHDKVSATIHEDLRRQVFFGYYDVTPFSRDSGTVLATRIPLHARPGVSEMEVGYYPADGGGGFQPLSRTLSWCWQQGCRLQWYPLDGHGTSGRFFHNAFMDGQYRGIIGSVHDPREREVVELPVYAFSHDGNYGLTLDFSRLQRLRPGYGYANLEEGDPADRAPERSGITVLDMRTREPRLVVSLKAMAEIRPQESMAGAEHYFNHLCAAPSGNRFLFFHLWIKDGQQHSRMVTCDYGGSDLHVFTGPDIVSHYWWKDARTIVCYSHVPGRGWDYYLFRDQRQEAEDVAPGVFSGDGHCSYSPDNARMLTDMYPDPEGFQRLFLFDGENKTTLAKQYSPLTGPVDERCDLHPRWSPDGRRIAFDGICQGRRRLVVLDVSGLVD